MTRTMDNDQLELSVILFNVGQGDHSLFKLPNGAYGVIDCHFDKNQRQPESPALSYFKYLYESVDRNDEALRKILKIDFLSISHTHTDHIRGMKELIEWLCNREIAIDQFWLCGASDQSSFNTLYRDLIAKGIEKKTPFKSKEVKESISAIRDHCSTVNKLIKQINEYPFGYGKSKPVRKFTAELNILKNNLGGGTVQASCAGPKSSDIKEFEEISYLNHIKKLFGPKIILANEKKLAEEEKAALARLSKEQREYWKPVMENKNLMSHILWFKFSSHHLLFTGDSHRNILESSINLYDADLVGKGNRGAHAFYADNTSFFKVAHHGAESSSSPRIWDYSLAKKQNAYLAISAGRNDSYNHPHSEALDEINQSIGKTDIYSTNLCDGCLDIELNKAKKTGSKIKVNDWYLKYARQSKFSNRNNEDSAEAMQKKKRQDCQNAVLMGRGPGRKVKDETRKRLLGVKEKDDKQKSGKTIAKRKLLAYEFVFTKNNKRVDYWVYDHVDQNNCFFKTPKHPVKLNHKCYDQPTSSQ